MIISEWTAIDENGRRSGRSVLVPDADRLAATLDEAPEAAGALRAALAPQQEIDDPEAIDPAHNTPTGELAGWVSPSRLNGREPVQSRIQMSNRFIAYDWDNDEPYIVREAEILESRVVARDSSGGHWHGSASDYEEDRSLRSLPHRVGRLDPATGRMSGGLWQTTWLAPEFAQEVTFEFRLLEIGGPNDGEENIFHSVQPSATRQIGFVRLPANDAHYARVGGTRAHPEDFNDWGEADIIRRVQNFAREYHEKTGDRTSVNDIALFFGGRFDAGRAVDGNWIECSGADQTVCWRYSHQEHRGSEADIRPIDRDNPQRRTDFAAILRNHFPSVHVEGTHWHVRDAHSPYGR